MNRDIIFLALASKNEIARNRVGEKQIWFSGGMSLV